MKSATAAFALGVAVVSGGVAVAQQTTRVSVDSSGAQADYESGGGSISADGQIVAFGSDATNLVTGDTNGFTDIFVHDRRTGVTERVSVDSTGAEANDWSYPFTTSISADGRFVAFRSFASNLVAGDTNGAWDIFVHDQATGITERVSVDSSGAEGNGDSDAPVLSSDGRFAAFVSDASNWIAGDTNTSDIFVRDRVTGTTERVSVDSFGVAGNDSSGLPAISADGRFVAFVSYSTNLVAGDTNGFRDIFVHDRSSGITERVSVDSSGVEGNGVSNGPSITADGQVVAFIGFASNLVSGDTNGVFDVFVHDRATGTTERVSVDSAGAQGNGGSGSPSISADGRIVAFFSDATNLIGGDTNARTDVFIHDRATGSTGRVSLDSAGAEGNGHSFPPSNTSLSADGQVVVIFSYATNLVAGDTNAFGDVFVRERCDAQWSNYGAGFAGTLGLPSLTAQADPVLGSTLTIDAANSYGASTFGLLFVGLERASIPTSRGGVLLVAPLLTVFIALPPSGASFTGAIPNDPALCGVHVDVQIIESDPGAAKGVSFTPGLELILGN